MKKSFLISMIISTITMAIVVYFIMNNEGDIPVHWNINGEIDGYGSSMTLLIFPSVSMIVTLLLYFIPNIDPKGDNIKKSGPILSITMILITVLMLGIVIIMIRAINGSDIFALTSFVSLIIGMLFIAIGYYAPSIKHNYTMGIRTPWTLHSETVWKKTHDVSKNWFIASGTLFIFGMFLKTPYDLVIPLIFMAVVMIGIVVYSYMLFKEEKGKRGTKNGK